MPELQSTLDRTDREMAVVKQLLGRGEDRGWIPRTHVKAEWELAAVEAGFSEQATLETVRGRMSSVCEEPCLAE